jgi:formate C-acetyltransferase
LRDRLLAQPLRLDVERALLVTASYRQTEGQPMALRRALMFRHLCAHTTVAIDPDELIVGNRAREPRMGVIAPEGAVAWLDAELETLPTRPQDRFQVEEADIRLLRTQVFPYWRGRTLEDAVRQELPAEVQAAAQAGLFQLNQTDHAQGHILPDVEGWLHMGIGGLRRKMELAQAANTACTAADFYRAEGIALDGAARFIERHAEALNRMAASAADGEQRDVWQSMADNCAWLASEPPRTFWQALQAVWFLMVLLQVESNASSFSPGRLDQYLLPYLLGDLQAGRLTLERAQLLVEHLWIKFGQIVLLRSAASARYFAGFPIGFNITLGGQTAAGVDATNLLSYICLRAQANVALTQPNLSVRLHAGTPQTFLLAAAGVVARGSGMPQFFGDDVIIAGLQKRGLTAEDARNYAAVGCVELSTPGKALGWSDAAMCNLVRILEITLHAGRDPQSGEQAGLPTPALAEMARYDEFEAAYQQQLAHAVGLLLDGCERVERLHAKVLPSPFLSLVVDDCLAHGQDVTAGGARYNLSGIQGVQLANVADSLAVLRQAVFEDGWLDGATLLDALARNWAGHDALRQRLLTAVPKYGNDDPRVDNVARHWAHQFAALLAERPNLRGGPYHAGFYTVSAHVPMGARVGATPDGRMAGEPLADGGLSPAAGRDRCGPTALLRSVGQLGLEIASNGALLNLKFAPNLFATDAGLAQFAHLLRAVCPLRIPHVQFNVVSRGTLRAAQADPQAHRHLVVRVAGYSAYFAELDVALQEEIISRTEYTTVT